MMALTMLSKAQDPQFSQFYASPIYLNPAFTGNSIQSRAAVAYRNQWAGVPNSRSFRSYVASYDHNLHLLNSGLGVLVVRDVAGNANLSSLTAAVSYAYRVRLNKFWNWKPALQFGFGQRSVDFSKLIFGDQLVTGNNQSASAVNNTNQGVSYMDINAGMVFYSRSFWFGMASHHLNRPNMSLLSNRSKLPIKLSAHMGQKLPLKKTIKGKVISSMMLMANYKHQNLWDQLDLGTYFIYDPFIFGAWYRGIPLKPIPGIHVNNESVIVLLGYKYYNVRFGYSYDVTISALGAPVSGGAHELTLIWEWHDKEQKRRRKPSQLFIPCPSF